MVGVYVSMGGASIPSTVAGALGAASPKVSKAVMGEAVT
jgi:hypothetical protein